MRSRPPPRRLTRHRTVSRPSLFGWDGGSLSFGRGLVVAVAGVVGVTVRGVDAMAATVIVGGGLAGGAVHSLADGRSTLGALRTGVHPVTAAGPIEVSRLAPPVRVLPRLRVAGTAVRVALPSPPGAAVHRRGRLPTVTAHMAPPAAAAAVTRRPLPTLLALLLAPLPCAFCPAAGAVTAAAAAATTAFALSPPPLNRRGSGGRRRLGSLDGGAACRLGHPPLLFNRHPQPGSLLDGGGNRGSLLLVL